MELAIIRGICVAQTHFVIKRDSYFSSQNTTKLEYLDLSRNLFGESAGIVLGPAIADNSSLKEINLSWNSIRRKGAVAIAQGVKVRFLMSGIHNVDIFLHVQRTLFILE